MPVERRDSASSTESDSCYEVAGVGSFNTMLDVDFTQTSSLPDSLQINTYTVGAGYQPYSRQFTVDNIVFNAGDSMSMLVPGNQSTSPIESAQVSTVYSDILYGSVTTVARAATASGTVHGKSCP